MDANSIKEDVDMMKKLILTMLCCFLAMTATQVQAVKAFGVSGTPSFIVQGKYGVDLAKVVDFLLQK